MRSEEISVENPELWIRVRKGDTQAVEELMSRYRYLVSHRAFNRYIVGGDSDDVLQEGMIGLYHAIQSYDEKKGSFESYAIVCIDHQILKAVEFAGRKKHTPLNESLSLDFIQEDEEGNTYAPMAGESLADPSGNPEALLLLEERVDRIKNAFIFDLSEMERKVARLWFLGYEYTEISRELGISPKSADNALQRIKKKIKFVLTSD